MVLKRQAKQYISYDIMLFVFTTIAEIIKKLSLGRLC